ncbi:MAG: rhodanese-like domain-containing protein [Planctomycetota bacterium]
MNYQTHWPKFLRCRMLIFVLVLDISSIVQGNEHANKIINTKRNSYAPYCGLYCVYTAFKLAEKDVEFGQLLKPEYIGSSKGSSLAELQGAAKDYGMYAIPLERLSATELRKSPFPIILHVKSLPASKEYDHYVLFLSDKDGKAMIFDPPNPVEVMPYCQLAPIWDGTGLIVSAEPISLSKIFASARKRFAMFSVAAIAAVLLIRFISKLLLRKVKNIGRSMNFGLSIAQFAALVIIALFGGMVYHFAYDAGFLAYAGATEPIVAANIENFIPKVDTDDVKNLISNRAVIIDSRQSSDFEAGHIENAINIPTTLCKAGRESKLADIAKNSQIVVYCQSQGCVYAAKVAANLFDDGFKNIFIYKNGWIEWQRNNSEQENENH